MSFEHTLKTISLEGASDLSTKQYYFVTLGASGLALTGDGGRMTGVLQDNAISAANRVGSVAYSGVSKVVASGVIAKGGYVSSDASGKATAAGSNDAVLGQALEAAAADGDIIPVLLGVGGPEYFA